MLLDDLYDFQDAFDCCLLPFKEKRRTIKDGEKLLYRAIK